MKPNRRLLSSSSGVAQTHLTQLKESRFSWSGQCYVDRHGFLTLASSIVCPHSYNWKRALASKQCKIRNYVCVLRSSRVNVGFQYRMPALKMDINK